MTGFSKLLASASAASLMLAPIAAQAADVRPSGAAFTVSASSFAGSSAVGSGASSVTGDEEEAAAGLFGEGVSLEALLLLFPLLGGFLLLLSGGCCKTSP